MLWIFFGFYVVEILIEFIFEKRPGHQTYKCIPSEIVIIIIIIIIVIIIIIIIITVPRSPLVHQILQQPALRAGELDTAVATAPMEEISEDKAESLKMSALF